MARTVSAGGASMVFTGRAEGNQSWVVGDGDPAAARARAAALVGVDASALVFMRQVHGVGVARVDEGDRGRGLSDHDDAVPDTDALVTTAADTALVVLTADCVPVLLSVPGAGAAAVHAGREGVVSGVVPAAVQALLAATGQLAAAVTAVVGPAIGGCCYEVPEGMAAAVEEAVPGTRSTTRHGSAGLDLSAGVRRQLQATGVERIEVLDGCTRCDPERWFSHRASTAGIAESGRQAAIVVMEAA